MLRNKTDLPLFASGRKISCRELGLKGWGIQESLQHGYDGTGFNLDSKMSMKWPWYHHEHHELVHEDSSFFLKVLFLYIQYEGASWLT